MYIYIIKTIMQSIIYPYIPSSNRLKVSIMLISKDGKQIMKNIFEFGEKRTKRN